MPCSVVNRLGSGESTQEDLAASTEQSTVKASLFVKNLEMNILLKRVLFNIVSVQITSIL